MWTRVVRCMLDHGTVQVEDGALLAAYCQAWGMLCAAASALNKLTVDDQLGDKGARLRRIIRESNDRIGKCTMHLGLSPVTRAKLLGDEPVTPDMSASEEIMAAFPMTDRISQPPERPTKTNPNPKIQ